MENTPKSQVVERLREAQNVLITVSSNPSVDQLSAAVGLTLMLNKLGKHATAVFSGQIPSTLDFLKPEATLETNTDSLRDFIISLDKAKADKLRYKVEEDFVKIFITPYRTSLSEADLNFSQGDFNVDVVVALGVDQREHIDQAILAHGRILHDATVIGVMAGENTVDVGSINWQEPNASSLCEMLVSISEAFQTGLLDGQMATAYLTGIVAETERFSNQKTSSKVMTMSAQLMAAGANQQLIATELQQPVIQDAPETLPEPVEEQENPDEAVLDLHHEEDEIHINEQGELSEANTLAEVVDQIQAPPEVPFEQREKRLEPLEESPDDTEVPSDVAGEPSKYIYEPPKTGGTLTANSQPEGLDPSTDPLTANSQDGYMVGGQGVDLQPIEAENKPEPVESTPSPLLSVQDDAESPSALDIQSTPDTMLPSDGESAAKPLGPEVHTTDTLEQIEQTVGEFSGEIPHADGESSEISADAARQAVLDAVSAAGGDYNPDRPEPIQSLNAQEFPETPEPEMPQVDQATDTPPSVPPPIMPPFPIPGAEVIEPPN